VFIEQTLILDRFYSVKSVLPGLVNTPCQDPIDVTESTEKETSLLTISATPEPMHVAFHKSTP